MQQFAQRLSPAENRAPTLNYDVGGTVDKPESLVRKVLLANQDIPEEQADSLVKLATVLQSIDVPLIGSGNVILSEHTMDKLRVLSDQYYFGDSNLTAQVMVKRRKKAI